MFYDNDSQVQGKNKKIKQTYKRTDIGNTNKCKNFLNDEDGISN